MNQTLPTADLNTAGTTDVIPSVAIDRIIAQRNEGIALFMQAMECLATARKILLDASGDIFLYGFEDCVTDSVSASDIRRSFTIWIVRSTQHVVSLRFSHQ
ncbi:hypothetical protein NFS57_24335, partial [Escherichia coli]|nr:hypothetical protein [Escherichia coli]